MLPNKKKVKIPDQAIDTKKTKAIPNSIPSRTGLTPEPTPDVTLVSPLIMPKIEREYTTAGITNSPPPPPDKKENITKVTPPPPSSNGAGVIGNLPPPKNFSGEPPAQTPAGKTSEDQGPTADTQQFGVPPPAGVEEYKMTKNYAKRTAEDIFNGLNYSLKWDVSPFMHVKYQGQFIKYHKITERIAQHSDKLKPSDIKERLKKHNSGIKDKIAMDQEDHDLIVPPAEEWFTDIGFKITPGWKVAIAGGQILLRKIGHVMEIKKENDEFKEELKAEISQFMDIYEQDIKPQLDEFEKSKRQAKTQAPSAKEDDKKTKPDTKKKQE